MTDYRKEVSVMKEGKSKTVIFGVAYGILLAGFTVYALLDVFVLPKSYMAAEAPQSVYSESAPAVEWKDGEEKILSSKANEGMDESGRWKHHGRIDKDGIISENSSKKRDRKEKPEIRSRAEEGTDTIKKEDTEKYTAESGSAKIEISSYRYMDTDIHVAKVALNDGASIMTAFANDTYGKNIKATVSEIAEEKGAVLAINGDFYGARNAGYVIRNGVLYRNTSSGNEDLVIYKDGSFEIVCEDEISAEELLSKGAYNVFSFGPALIENGEIAVSEGEEVGRAMYSNPRTAIAIMSDGSYLFVVSDGRTDDDEGLSLSSLSSFLKELGAVTAYNLDGGGSSTMVYNGELINDPTTSGRNIKEREVSDIIYIS